MDKKPAADKSNSLENKKLQLEPATGLNYSGNGDNVMLQMFLSVDLYCNLKLLCERKNIQESAFSLAQKRKKKLQYDFSEHVQRVRVSANSQKLKKK